MNLYKNAKLILFSFSGIINLCKKLTSTIYFDVSLRLEIYFNCFVEKEMGTKANFKRFNAAKTLIMKSFEKAFVKFANNFPKHL